MEFNALPYGLLLRIQNPRRNLYKPEYIIKPAAYAALRLDILDLEIAFVLTAMVFLGDILTLVIKLLASSETYLYLDQSILHIYLKRNDCISLLHRLAGELVNLAAVK